MAFDSVLAVCDGPLVLIFATMTMSYASSVALDWKFELDCLGFAPRSPLDVRFICSLLSRPKRDVQEETSGESGVCEFK